MKQKQIFDRAIPIPGFIAMSVLFWLFIRKEYKHTTKLTKDLIRHEGIHGLQQLELLVLSLFVAGVTSFFTGLHWWMLVNAVLFPLLLYGFCWLVEIILPPYNQAYRNICFETEAIYNEWNEEYLKTRPPFAWLKYISNKKYPYITQYERQKRNKALRQQSKA